MSMITSSRGGQEEENLVDVTRLVERAASSLTHDAPLLRNNDTFSLMDAMAALEVTDPIMDCCELPAVDQSPGDRPRRAVPPRRLPSGLHHPLSSLPWDGLTLGDARIIALETMTRLNAVLSGAGAAESTYTCLYAHDDILIDMANELSGTDEDKLSSAAAAKHVVYASALLLVKLHDLVRTIGLNADIYEEEDFTVSTHGFLFAPKWDPNILRKAVNTAISALRKLRGKDNTVSKEDDAKLLTLLLQLQLIFFEACTSLSNLTAANVKLSVEETKTDVLAQCLKKAKDLQEILDDASKDTECSEGGDERSKRILNAAFDPYMYRSLMGNAPVRKVKFKSPSAALNELIRIMSEIEWAVCDLILKGSSLARIKRMLEHVSISSANILSRSLIVLNLFFDDLLLGQYDISILITEHMHQHGGVPLAVTNTEHCRAFAGRLGKPVYDNLKVLALNRNRQHAYMDALVLKEWPPLQQDATNLDCLFRQELGLENQTAAFMTNYVTSLTVAIMEHYISLSVELGLFRNHHDLAISFWYLAFLSSTRINIMTTMRQARIQQNLLAAQLAGEREESDAPIEPTTQSRSKKKGRKAAKRTTPSKPPAHKETKEDVEDDIEFMVLTLKRTLCRGIVRVSIEVGQCLFIVFFAVRVRIFIDRILCRPHYFTTYFVHPYHYIYLMPVQFIAALDQAGLSEIPEYEFTSHKMRFEKRYEAFSIVTTPQPLTYDDFEQGYSYANVSQQALIASATECFKDSKAVVDKLLSKLSDKGDDCYAPIRKQEVMNIAKVCVGNSLFLHKLSQQVQNGGKAKGTVSFDFEAHRAFCTIKIM